MIDLRHRAPTIVYLEDLHRRETARTGKSSIEVLLTAKQDTQIRAFLDLANRFFDVKLKARTATGPLSGVTELYKDEVVA